MTERFLIDLMSELDFSLLEDQYMERDLLNQKQASKRHWFRKKALKKGTEFALTDSLRAAVYEQRELIDTMVAHPNMEEETLTNKLDIKVEAVKKNVNWVIAIASAIISIIVVAASVILVIFKKKSIAKLFGKRVQAAC